MFSRLKSQHGFSLIEIVVAAGVLGISMMGFSYMFANARGVTDDLGTRRMALARAEQRMEGLKRTGFGSVMPGSETITIDNNLTGSRQWTVSDIDEDINGTVDYKLVTVTISWTGRTGNSQSVSLATFIAP